MTDELTLREKVLGAYREARNHEAVGMDFLNTLATILEDIGSPAHMRVAAELRGE